MKKQIVLKDCTATANNEGFYLCAGCASLSLAFDENFGFLLNSFKNTSSAKPIEYVWEPYPFMPISQKIIAIDDKSREGKFDEFVNIESTENTTVRRIESVCKWTFVDLDVSETLYGGAKVLAASLSISNGNLTITMHAVAFPECSVIRYYFEIKNISEKTLHTELCPLSMQLTMDSFNDIYHAYWFKGGYNCHDYGKICEQALGIRVPKVEISSNMTTQYIPLTVIARDGDPNDGVMIEVDYCARWKMSVERVDNSRVLECNFMLNQDDAVRMLSGERIETPVITLAVYAGDMDELMVRLYDWQYTYMWDYTQNDYYAKFRCDTAPYPWVYCSRILNEQFGYRLTSMDLHGGKMLTEAGMEMSWDDAGWSSFDGWPEDGYQSVFANTYEGPDHRLSTRFFDKLGIKRLIWFAGKPSLGVLGTKEGAWGEFEWRTDGLDNIDFADEKAFKKRIKDYLDGGLRRSFHTCSGGARYASTFDIQRYANYHYACDSGAGPCRNYYYSYFMLPDRWGDFLPTMGGEYTASDGSHCFLIDTELNHYYNPDYARSNMSMCGMFAPLSYENIEFLREDVDVYHNLLKNGVAGRWSYMFHPGVYGDKEIYYLQRTSRDRLRACIVIRRRPSGRVVIYPKGLIANEIYTVSFDISENNFKKSGQDLMENGISIQDPAPRELIYLNITSPKRLTDYSSPEVFNAVCRRENNVGASGIGIYWAANTDSVRYYEVARNGEIIAKLPSTRYWFDEDADFENVASYSVRGVNNAGCGEWKEAVLLSGDSVIYSTLGSHGEDFSKNHWSAETSEDLIHFEPMKWVKPAKNPGADFRGTPNQEGGIEGYWEGGLCAKIGRGWQQSSPDKYCVRSFTVPSTGRIKLTGRAVKEWYHSEYGCDVEVFVMKNSEVIIQPHLIRSSDIDGISYNTELDVVRGDVLRFVVGKCDPEHNSVVHYEKDANIIGWNTIITYSNDSDTACDFSLKINCGSDTLPEQNCKWIEDRYYTGGKTQRNICNSEFKDKLYTTARIADVGETISYNIPVPNGIYAVRLCFAECKYTSANERFMKIRINGAEVEHELDITHDVREAGVPFTKVYHYVVPNDRGEIAICLTSVRGGSCISGIELYTECDDVWHINCGGEDFVDWAGYIWNADRYYTGGVSVKEKNCKLSQASPTLYDRRLYFTGRCGNDIAYNIPVRNGIYSIQLKFAEFELEKSGDRPIDIFINGQTMKKSWDILSTAGEAFMSSDLRFDDISSDNGFIRIRITAKGNNPAVLRAIEID